MKHIESLLNVSLLSLNYDIDKRLCEEINSNKLKPYEIQKIAGSLGIIPGDNTSNSTRPISTGL